MNLIGQVKEQDIVDWVGIQVLENDLNKNSKKNIVQEFIQTLRADKQYFTRKQMHFSIMVDVMT